MRNRLGDICKRLSAWTNRLLVRAEVPPSACAGRMTAADANGDDRPPCERDRLRALADNLPHAMIYQVVPLPDGRKRFTYVSESVQRLHELTPQAVLDNPDLLYGQILPEQLPAMRAAEQRAFETRTPFHHEVACRLPSGRVHWFELNSVPNPLSDGRIAWDGLEVDITSRKEAEHAQRAGEEEFRAFFETAVVGAVHINPDTYRFTQVNDRYCRMVGYTREELLERTFLDITYPEERETNREQFDRLMRGECREYFFQKRYIRKDGQVIWVQVSLAVVRDDQGRAVRACGVIQDVTHDKLAEDALRRSEQRFRSLVEATAAIVWGTSASGEFEQDQPGWRAFTGQTTEQYKGLGWLQAGHPDDRERIAQAWTRAVATRTYYHDEHRLRRHDGVYRHMLARAIPILDEAGEVREWIGVHNDVEDLKQAEQSALRAAEQHRLALDVAHLGTWEYNLAAGQVLWDERCRDIFGAAETNEIAFTRVLELIHPEDRESLMQRVSDATAPDSNGSCESEFRVLWPDSSIHWVSAKLQAVFEGEGKSRRAVRFIGTVMDTTERKRAEEALRESEEYFRTLADNMAQFAWMADEKGSFFWYNKRWYDYTGTTLDDMRGWGWQKVQDPDHVQRVTEKIKYCFETGTVWEDTFPLRGKDGNYRWFLAQAVPIRDEKGNVLRWFGTNTDITELREAEQRLRESRALYRNRLAELQTIYRSAPIGLCVLDRDFRFVRVNDHLAEMNGLPAGDHIGRTVGEVVPDVVDQEMHSLRQVLETGQPIVDTEVSGQTRAMPGVTRHWLVSYYPMSNDAGEIVGINITAQEITDRKRAEQERQQLLEAEQAARAESERYNRLKDEFLATVSHELRSPLNAILGWTRLLTQGKAEAGRALEIVERNASGLAQIVEDLLDMSRIISGKVQLHRRLADVGPLANSVMESVQLAAQAKGISLNAWIDPQLRPILCDPNRIQQIIWNLLTNAVKFTPAGGQVWLRVAQPADAVTITVQDNGQGIPPEFLPQIFGRFQQVDSSITRRHGGLGLGLSITRHLVELHGGTICGASEGKDRGATFTVRLPSYQPSATDESDRLVRQGPSRPIRPSGDEDVQSLLASATVLVVDDDPDSCELAARILRDAGATVHLANSAERGFEVLMDVRPDVLISDISMPQQDGYAFVRKVRSCGGWCADLVCVALTALARPEDRTGALEAGYDDYLTKPFDARALSLLVSTLTQGRQSQFGRGNGMKSHQNDVPFTADERKRDGNRLHILLAEDNAAISEMLRLFLEGAGYSVSIAPTVQQAVDIAERQKIDLLLSDFRLKDGTGWQLMEKLAARRPVPGVMLSGYSDSFYIQKSKAAGFSHYLVKPVEEDQLIAAIQEAVSEFRLQHP